MFINCSNHTSVNWSEAQLDAARKYGDVVDYKFPLVSPKTTTAEIVLLAEKVCEEIVQMHPEVVMCQGEFTLCFSIVSILKEKGIKVVAACTERNVVEKNNDDGTTTKTAVFEFVKFREY